MAEFAKKLTVSFGAFSCTLSGFDDPFPVMRQVVDYFQDLADRDPAFGAHPERPDTEALRHIAEEASGLGVNADTQDGTLHLSADEPAAAPELSTQSTSAAMADTVEADRQYHSEMEAAAPLGPVADQPPLTAPQNAKPQPQPQPEAQKALPPEDESDLSDHDATPKDIRLHVSQKVRFEDASDLESEDTAALKLIEAEDAEKTIPLWLSELNSDAPIGSRTQPEPSDKPHQAPDSIPLGEHHHAEQAARDLIVAATQPEPAPAPAPDAKSAVPPAPQPEKPSPQKAARQQEPLMLGFGDRASLDATWDDVETSTLDRRNPPSATDALSELGLFDPEDDEHGFEWNSETPPAAPAPKAAAAPLLLSPKEAVEKSPPVAPTPSRPVSVDLEQEDPRKDLRAFANAVGAVSLTELMEVSAAYSTLIKGRPSFTRSEVMGLVETLGGDDGFTQEARVKSFGSLLRGGRIQAVENGQYEISRDVLYAYEASRKVC